jgi:integrase
VASVARRPDGRWRARYRDAGGKEHARHFDRKVDAQRWLDETKASVLTGQYVDPKAGRITLRQYAEGWQATHVGSDASGRIVDNALRLHLLPALGERPVSSVRRGDVQALVKRLSEQLGPGSVRNVYEVLSRVMGAAVDDRVIVTSPCVRITLPTLVDVDVVPPTVEQVRGMADAIGPRYRAAVVLLAGSGLRIGELLGLRVSDVDFLRRTVRVERQRRQDGAVTAPKTARSIRTVPLAQVVLDELAKHLVVFPSSEWLFTTAQGEPVGYRAWKSAWQAAHSKIQADENKAAVREDRKPVIVPEMTTHDLRHCFASALISGGASVKQVQTVLGHSSAMVTLKVYSHLWPGDEDRTRSIIEANFGLLRTRCGPDDLAADKTASQEG